MVEYLGNTSYAYVDTPQGSMIVQPMASRGSIRGDSVGLALGLKDAHIFDDGGKAWPHLT